MIGFDKRDCVVMSSDQNDCFIFDYTDIADIIFDMLDFATISAVAPVCKRFAVLSKKHYPKRLQSDIIDPAKRDFNKFFDSTMCSYVADHYFSIVFFVHINNFTRVLERFEAFATCFLEDNYWLLLLNDFDVMESMFIFVSRINYLMETHKNDLFFNNGFSNTEYYERVTLYYRLHGLFDSLDAYLYMEYPERYGISEVHMMARFKKIKKHWGMKKTALVRALRRPVDEVYYLQ